METNSQLGQTQKITVDICLYADYINILFSFISTDTVVNILEYSMYKIDNYLTLLFFLLFAGNYENKNLLFLLLKHEIDFRNVDNLITASIEFRNPNFWYIDYRSGSL